MIDVCVSVRCWIFWFKAPFETNVVGILPTPLYFPWTSQCKSSIKLSAQPATRFDRKFLKDDRSRICCAKWEMWNFSRLNSLPRCEKIVKISTLVKEKKRQYETRKKEEWEGERRNKTLAELRISLWNIWKCVARIGIILKSVSFFLPYIRKVCSMSEKDAEKTFFVFLLQPLGCLHNNNNS